MENRKKSFPNGLAQLCGLAQFYRLFKTLSTIFLLTKKKWKKYTWTLEMGTYHWDWHIGCFHGIYMYLQCSALCALLRGIYPSPGSAKQVKIKSEMWLELVKITCSWERHINMWESCWNSSCFYQDFQRQHSRSARCATCNERQTMNRHFSKERLRWAHIIEKVRGFANIPWI